MNEASNPMNFGFIGFFGIREGGFEVASAKPKNKLFLGSTRQ
ncbi:hypothetical protein MKY19_10500 [Paenibacillus sp. FSL R5-0744]